jgi:predicted hydrocarbon binding protein
MGKVGKTFTLDLKVLAWLEQYANKQKEAESYIVNQMLNSEMRKTQIWKCPECDGTNHISEKVCWATTGCKGVKA